MRDRIAVADRSGCRRVNACSGTASRGPMHVSQAESERQGHRHDGLGRSLECRWSMALEVCSYDGSLT